MASGRMEFHAQTIMQHANFSFVGQELPDYIQDVFGYCGGREDTLIGGLDWLLRK